MKNLELGIATIHYDLSGNVIKEKSFFRPTMKLPVPESTEFESIGNDNPDALRKNAEAVFATWFSKVDEIQLADRELYDIKTTNVICNRYGNGRVKSCVLKFEFVKR